MRSNFELEIKRENGTKDVIKMYSTVYQAKKALTALSYALNKSSVERLVLWVLTPKGKVQYASIGYEKPMRSA